MSRLPIDIRPLTPTDLPAVRLHHLSLSPDDRYARFGMPMNDEAIWRWTSSIRWADDLWLGAWLPPDCGLVGVLHLSPTNRHGTSELALTVHALVRRHGIATRLFARAVQHQTALDAMVCEHGHDAIRSIGQNQGWPVSQARGNGHTGLATSRSAHPAAIPTIGGGMSDSPRLGCLPPGNQSGQIR